MEKPKRNIYLKMKILPEAREIWEGRTGALRTAEEQVQAASGLGRVTSGPIIALRSVPHYHGAAMDGYAVRAGDTYGASDTTPLRLRSDKAPTRSTPATRFPTAQTRLS